MNRLILASASPRRRELLAQIGVRVDVAPADIDEHEYPNETAAEYVKRLAEEKAKVGFERGDGRPALGSDTTVVVDDQILGKPLDFNEAQRMLKQLSGRSHQVITAVAIHSHSFVESRVVVTDVEFRALSETEIAQYWESGEPTDKAGGYGIQGLGAVFVKRIEGSYSSVVGLPLCETAELLAQAGVPVWQTLRD